MTILHMRYGYFSEKTFKGYEITDKCIQCGKCERICPQKRIKDFVINQTHCLH
ncbi:4Fe-4S binding protein [Coprococcus eutactus]|uniref:4Fe-4S binding protein n=1 Tax=Coprococcus eutactus TaxID=33043 RepID=UPI00015E9891|nr:4Fe-4S binding protein [Coprococcus eutactus]EDP25688.1 4Fe-4S binding domain protein [Coprococcus eutactus ATCC 27759]